MPTERVSAWIQASWRMSGHAHDNHLVFDIQDVGHLEAAIQQLEAQIDARMRQNQPSDVSQARSLSRLWLLGLYEALRAYKTKCRGDAWLPFKDLFVELNAIRSPLAKHQVAGTRDPHVTQPTYVLGVGIGWTYYNPRTSAYEQTSRREISDRFLGIVASLAGAGEIEAAASAEGS